MKQLTTNKIIETNCHILYSEDLQHGLVLEKRMEIINPFISLR